MNHQKLIIRTIAICLGLICFMANPLFLLGCDQISATHFEFTQQDMQRELAQISPTHDLDKEPYRVELTLSASPTQVSTDYDADSGMSIFSTAEACSSRTFVASAAACIDTTTLHVQGTLSVIRTTAGQRETLLDAVPVLGTYVVHGTQLDNGRIDFGASGIQGMLDYDREAKSFVLGRIESRRDEATFVVDKSES